MDAAPHSNETLVLMYHYVGQSPVGDRRGFVSVARPQFECDVAAVIERYEPVDWQTFIKQRGRPGAGGKPRVLFTFDDGLRCQVECAVPVLERHGIRGVFLVPGATLRERALLDAHMLHILLSRHSDEAVFGALSETMALEPYVNEREANRIYHYERSAVRRRLKYLFSTGLPIERRRPALQTLFTNLIEDKHARASDWYASADDWKALVSRGHTIGAHGFSHERLETLDSTAQLADLKASADAIDTCIGLRPTVMSYPLGSYDARTRDAAHAAGFVAAFTTHHALDDGRSDPLQIPRVDCARLNEFLSQPAEVSS